MFLRWLSQRTVTGRLHFFSLVMEMSLKNVVAMVI